MSSSQRPSACLTVIVSLAILVTPASAKPLDEIIERRKALEQDVDQALLELEELRSRLEEAETDLEVLEDRRVRSAREVSRSEDVVSDRVRQHAMQPDTTLLATALNPNGLEEAMRGATMLALVHRRDHERLEEAQAALRDLAAVEDQLLAKQEKLAQLEEEFSERAEGLQQRLQKVTRRERYLRAQRASRQRVDRGPQQGTYACIFDQGMSNFINSWGFPRSGGRSHKGADVMAPRAAKVYAFTAGTVGRTTTGGLGGVSLRIQGDDQNRYYYAHLQEFAEGLRPGMRVEAGQLVGLNGASGNARGGPTHVHFQVHPGGGAATNPYPWLRAVCR